jgi:DNA (cytosine-5)-methyltransferase 1
MGVLGGGRTRVEASWQQGWDLTEEKREWFRQKSIKSASRKKSLMAEAQVLAEEIKPRLDPSCLMPIQSSCQIDSVSLFSGCGGLDIGFERAGYRHLLSVDILDICGETLKVNRPEWEVLSGPDQGDVRKVTWRKHATKSQQFLVLHGGPPCQPFSNAGRQLGKDDPRNMVPEFFRAIRELQPDAFVMENVPALGSQKFARYLEQELQEGIGNSYFYKKFFLFAPDFGVPQQRRRLFVVGFRSVSAYRALSPPEPTHSIAHFVSIHKSLATHVRSIQNIYGYNKLPRTMGVREAIGLSSGYPDGLAPTFRSGFTGPRNSTSILNGASSQKVLAQMGIWGNGVSQTRQAAAAFPPENGTHRLSVQDISLIQGFPSEWKVKGPVYKIIGQIGNSVAPPVAYNLAIAIRNALLGSSKSASLALENDLTLAAAMAIRDHKERSGVQLPFF